MSFSSSFRTTFHTFQLARIHLVQQNLLYTAHMFGSDHVQVVIFLCGGGQTPILRRVPGFANNHVWLTRNVVVLPHGIARSEEDCIDTIRIR